jgi:hypothetical protein
VAVLALAQAPAPGWKAAKLAAWSPLAAPLRLAARAGGLMARRPGVTRRAGLRLAAAASRQAAVWDRRFAAGLEPRLERLAWGGRRAKAAWALAAAGLEPPVEVFDADPRALRQAAGRPRRRP